MLLIDVLHDVFDMQRVQSQNIHIKSCFIHFIPLVSFCTPWKHQKTSAFLIYRVFTGIGLSTVGYLRDLCSRLLMKRGVGLNSRPRIIATKSFSSFCKRVQVFLCSVLQKRPKMGLAWLRLLYFSLVYMFKELIFINQKNNNHLRLKRYLLIRILTLTDILAFL